MRFIAVFDQMHSMHGVGFDTLLDASDFLFWGYEDNELIPHGIYDVFTMQVSVYDHAGQRVGDLEEATIREFALTYIGRIRRYVVPAY